MPIQAENFEVNGIPVPVADAQAREDIETLNSSLTQYKTRTTRTKVAYDSTSSNTWYEATIIPDAVSGYTCVGVAGWTCNKSNVYPYTFYWTGSGVTIGISRASGNLSDVKFSVVFEYAENA